MAKYIVLHGIKIAKDFTSETFGRLTTIGPKFRLPVGTQNHYHQVCACTCGNTKIVGTRTLASGEAKSCGCILAEKRVGKKKRTRKYTPEQYIWRSMLSRCYCKSTINYPEYGGRGIGVSSAWRGKGGFERWLAHIGPRPSKEHTMDRLEVDGNYEPGNVRWATWEEQMNNTRRNIYLKYQDKEMTISQWAKETGMDYELIYGRYKSGWATGKIFTTPKKTRKRCL